MKRISYALSVALIAAPLAILGQTPTSSSGQFFAEPEPAVGGAQVVSPAGNGGGAYAKPLTQYAVGGGVSTLGINMQLATNINQHLNIRGMGNVFNYNTNFTTNGFTANAKLGLATGGAVADIYPFHVGFRLSAGLMFFNHNQMTATDTVAGGTSFTLNGDTFYSANANAATGATPVNGTAALNLNTIKPAFIVSTGWGNMIPRKGWRVSFPVEVGVAFSGAPSLDVHLAGWACHDQAQTQCTNLTSNDPIAIEVQNDLKVQVAKWKNDLDPLKTAPMVSVGVAYSFGPR